MHRESLTAARFPPGRTPGVERSGTLPNDWYTSPELFDLEQRTLLPRGVDVRRPRRPGRRARPVLHLRGRRRAARSSRAAADGELHALSNVCLHRAGPVAMGCGTRKAFQCPYHGWTYKLDGSMRRAQGMEGTERVRARRACACREFRVGDVGQDRVGCLEPDAPSLEEWMADITPRLANYETQRPQVRGRPAGGEIECNWKMYVDNYMEGYHIPFIHPGLAQSLIPSVYTYRLGEYSNEQYGGRAAPARARLARGRHPRRHPGVPRAQAADAGPRRVRADGLLLPLGVPAHDDQLHARRDPDVPGAAARARAHRDRVHVVVPATRRSSRIGCCRPRSSTSATS